MTDRLQLMIEADRRGILPPEQKALLDEAVRRWFVQQDKPAVVQAGEMIRQVPRQLGLTVRHAAEGLAEVADIFAAPVAGAYNTVANLVSPPTMSGQVTGDRGFRFRANPTRTAVSSVADLVGLPTPEGPTERVVGDVSRLVAGTGGLSAGAKTISNLVSGPVAEAATSFAANPGQQAVSAATAGGAGGATRETGGGPGAQFGASLVGGLSGAGLSELGVRAYDAISNAVRQWRAPTNSLTEINVVLNQILERDGIKLSQLPTAVRGELAGEVKKALDTGSQINPDVVRRIADYGVVGATPTRGTVTLDPVQITQERNLAKLGANSTDPKLQQLARVQNENNRVFIDNLNRLGGNTRNADPVVAGTTAMGHIRSADDTARETERALYGRARDSTGRQLDLDREGFVFDAYNRLGESNKSAFLPEGIKTILEQIRTGKMKMPDGSERQTPFNVDVIDTLKTILATASRSSTDGNTRAAIAQVRNALEEVQPRAVGRPVGGNQVVDPVKLNAAQTQADDLSAASMSAFDEARSFARNRRNWQESTPGIVAALADDAQPDRFVRDFVIGNSGKGATAHVERLMHEFHNNPTALNAIKENVVAYLKNKALSGASDEVGNFSQSAFNRALNDLGDRKLRLFFSTEEISQLKALGRVSSYEMVQPKGSAVNNSNTAGTFAGILDRIASSPLVGKIPFGDVAVRGPARNWSAQIGTNTAMDPYGGMSVAARPAPRARISDLMGPGLLLTAPVVEGRNDEKRR